MGRELPDNRNDSASQELRFSSECLRRLPNEKTWFQTSVQQQQTQIYKLGNKYQIRVSPLIFPDVTAFRTRTHVSAKWVACFNPAWGIYGCSYPSLCPKAGKHPVQTKAGQSKPPRLQCDQVQRDKALGEKDRKSCSSRHMGRTYRFKQR
jgi:hypothetical protein